MTETVETESRILRARVGLVSDIERCSAVLSSRVVEAFLNVPRHPFVPVFHSSDRTGRLTSADGEVWLREVYANRVLVTEVDDVGGTATSSSTLPSLMADMLDALDIRLGDRVLEIGTGTGYNAALLCHLAGAENVTTLDCAAPLVTAARDRLREVGFEPDVLAADGAAGHPGGAPYDRIIATCSVPRIPQAWLDQCAPGGTIVAPIGGALDGGAVACLTKLPDGRAVGRFLAAPAAFMPLRSGAATTPAVPGSVEGQQRTTAVGARVLDDYGFSFWASLHLPPNVVRQAGTLHDPVDGSAAQVQDHPDGPATVTTAGPQDLWQIVEAAHTAWQRHHRPRREWLTIEVTADGQRIGHSAPNATSASWAR
ncbi:methyltransferase domain-containing protein [Kitasatospora sp. NBC_00039]|uniref:methyltransferase domain-containing protein n=1 Tax=Kitasatospora sp. NBC_00039 TaxID=2903565 RepID=UPI003249DD23